MESKFWMVYRTESAHGPKVKHTTLGEAIQEANRLAAIYPGTYLILESVARVASHIENMGIAMTGYEDPTEG